jgi:hypothetical protein
VILFGARALLCVFLRGPENVADEVAYLTNARLFAGGLPGQLSLAPLYRGGYSFVIAPVVALDLSPTTTYRLIVVVNALLIAAVLPLLYLLLTRTFAVPERPAFLAALVGAAYPSLTAWSQLAMSENLLAPVTVLWLLSCGQLVAAGGRRRSQVSWTLLTAACAAVLWIAHGRMVVALVVSAAAFAALAASGTLDRAAAAVGTAVLVGGFLVGHFVDDYLVSRSYGGQVFHEAGQRLRPLTTVRGILELGRNVIGQSWYLLVATLGIVAVYLLAEDLIGIVRRLRAPREADAVLALLLAYTVSLLIVSTLSFHTIGRTDQFVYGRYVEPAVPPLIAVAVARLATPRRLPRLAPIIGALLVLTTGVAVLRTTIHPGGHARRFQIASLPFATGNLTPSLLVGAGIVASAAAIGLYHLARRRPASLAPAALVAFLLVAVYTEWDVVDVQRSFYPAHWTAPTRVADEHAIGLMAYDVDTLDRRGIWVYQWFLPHTRVVLFHSSDEPPPTRYFISAKHLRGQASAVRLWSDSFRDQALWERRG